MTGVLIRDATADDMTALSGVYRRSSLSNEGDRPDLLAHPENAGFVVYQEVVTRFRTAPRMRLDVTA